MENPNYYRTLPPDFMHLVKTGGQLIENPDARRGVFPGLVYATDHPEGEYQQGEAVIADMQTIERIPIVYVIDSPELSWFKDGKMKTPDEFIAEQRTESGIIIGVSGYASKGFDYTRQARLLFIALGEIREQKRKNIDLVITGGTRYGDVALANEIAVGLTIPRMAFVPRIGLHSLVEAPEHIPPVHYLCVVGDKFGDETPYVGSTPDLLFLIGGGENSEREIEAALAKREFLKSQGKEGNRVAVIDFVDNPWTSVTERYQRLAEAKKLPDGVSYLNTMHDLMSFLKTV